MSIKQPIRYKFKLELDKNDSESGGNVVCTSKYLITCRSLQFMTSLLSVKQLNKLKCEGVLIVLLNPELLYKR